MRKSSENRDKTVKIEAFYAVDRIEEKRQRAIQAWADIVRKILIRRDSQWNQAA